MAYIVLCKENFYHNLDQLTLKAGAKHKIAVVLKDNAYGHGLEEMAQMAAEYGIKEAVVADNDEALRIRELFTNVLVLGDTPRIDKRLSYAISEVESLRHIAPEVKVELKVDTGMHRNGISLQELDEALTLVKDRGIQLFGVMTHYRSADELTSEFFWQKKTFASVKSRVRQAGFDQTRFHSCNSAALLRSVDFDETIARVGIAIYGFDTLPEGFEKSDLRPVLSLWARRASRRTLRPGQRVGYSGEFTVPKTMKVSTYDLGYGDGWPRGDAHDPYVTEEGCRILGRVSMDYLSLEEEKETVCIMRDAARAARHFGTIPYEMTTALQPTLPRRIHEEKI